MCAFRCTPRLAVLCLSLKFSLCCPVGADCNSDFCVCDSAAGTRDPGRSSAVSGGDSTRWSLSPSPKDRKTEISYCAVHLQRYSSQYTASCCEIDRASLGVLEVPVSRAFGRAVGRSAERQARILTHSAAHGCRLQEVGELVKEHASLVSFWFYSE